MQSLCSFAEASVLTGIKSVILKMNAKKISGLLCTSVLDDYATLGHIDKRFGPIKLAQNVFSVLDILITGLENLKQTNGTGGVSKHIWGYDFCFLMSQG